MNRRWLWLPLSALLAGCGYNTIQTLDERTTQQKANISQELQRRNDLIPNLVATVDQAARFEQQTQTRIAEARAGLTQSKEQLDQALKQNASAEELSRANAAVTDNLRSFINISVEAYPDLKSNANFAKLQDELVETENRLSVSRRDYNEAVANNTYIRRFPQAITAKVIGANRREPFEAPAAATEAPRVQFPTNQ
jgi:LemA protein